MFHRMESYNLKGTWCQSYEVKIVGLQQVVVVFIKIYYTLTGVTLQLA